MKFSFLLILLMLFLFLFIETVKSVFATSTMTKKYKNRLKDINRKYEKLDEESKIISRYFHDDDYIDESRNVDTTENEIYDNQNVIIYDNQNENYNNQKVFSPEYYVTNEIPSMNSNVNFDTDFRNIKYKKFGIDPFTENITNSNIPENVVYKTVSRNYENKEEDQPKFLETTTPSDQTNSKQEILFNSNQNDFDSKTYRKAILIGEKEKPKLKYIGRGEDKPKNNISTGEEVKSSKKINSDLHNVNFLNEIKNFTNTSVVQEFDLIQNSSKPNLPDDNELILNKFSMQIAEIIKETIKKAISTNRSSIIHNIAEKKEPIINSLKKAVLNLNLFDHINYINNKFSSNDTKINNSNPLTHNTSSTILYPVNLSNNDVKNLFIKHVQEQYKNKSNEKEIQISSLSKNKTSETISDMHIITNNFLRQKSISKKLARNQEHINKKLTKINSEELFTSIDLNKTKLMVKSHNLTEILDDLVLKDIQPIYKNIELNKSNNEVKQEIINNIQKVKKIIPIKSNNTEIQEGKVFSKLNSQNAQLPLVKTLIKSNLLNLNNDKKNANATKEHLDWLRNTTENETKKMFSIHARKISEVKLVKDNTKQTLEKYHKDQSPSSSIEKNKLFEELNITQIIEKYNALKKSISNSYISKDYNLLRKNNDELKDPKDIIETTEEKKSLNSSVRKLTDFEPNKNNLTNYNNGAKVEKIIDRKFKTKKEKIIEDVVDIKNNTNVTNRLKNNNNVISKIQDSQINDKRKSIDNWKLNETEFQKDINKFPKTNYKKIISKSHINSKETMNNENMKYDLKNIEEDKLNSKFDKKMVKFYNNTNNNNEQDKDDNEKRLIEKYNPNSDKHKIIEEKFDEEHQEMNNIIRNFEYQAKDSNKNTIDRQKKELNDTKINVYENHATLEDKKIKDKSKDNQKHEAPELKLSEDSNENDLPKHDIPKDVYKNVTKEEAVNENETHEPKEDKPNDNEKHESKEEKNAGINVHDNKEDIANDSETSKVKEDNYNNNEKNGFKEGKTNSNEKYGTKEDKTNVNEKYGSKEENSNYNEKHEIKKEKANDRELHETNEDRVNEIEKFDSKNEKKNENERNEIFEDKSNDAEKQTTVNNKTNNDNEKSQSKLDEIKYDDKHNKSKPNEDNSNDKHESNFFDNVNEKEDKLYSKEVKINQNEKLDLKLDEANGKIKTNEKLDLKNDRVNDMKGESREDKTEDINRDSNEEKTEEMKSLSKEEKIIENRKPKLKDETIKANENNEPKQDKIHTNEEFELKSNSEKLVSKDTIESHAEISDNKIELKIPKSVITEMENKILSAHNNHNPISSSVLDKKENIDLKNEKSIDKLETTFTNDNALLDKLIQENNEKLKELREKFSQIKTDAEEKPEENNNTLKKDITKSSDVDDSSVISDILNN